MLAVFSVYRPAFSSPEGLVNAGLYTENTANTYHRFNTGNQSYTQNQAYTFSLFAKADSGSRYVIINCASAFNARAFFDIDNGTYTTNSGTADIEDFGNGWYRCIVTGTRTAATGTDSIYFGLNTTEADSAYTGDGTSGAYFWGAQLESGNYATSIIPTYGTTASRAKDVCGATNISSVIGQNEGVIFMDFVWNDASPSGGDYALMVYGTSTANFVSLNANGNANQMLVYSGGSAVASIGGTAFTDGQRYKIALVYSENYFAYYQNGVLKGTDTSGAVPTGLANLRTDTPFGQKSSSQKTNQILFFPTALTDAECITLTTL